MLTNEEWENEEKDAGEIGAGHTVTAVYEIVLGGEGQSTMGDYLLKVSVRYKNPDEEGNTVHEMNKYAIQDDITQTPAEDGLFISAVVEAALVMRNSQYKGQANLNSVISRLERLDCVAHDAYKAEFLDLMKKLRETYN